MRYGVGYQDLWNLDFFLAERILPCLKRFKEMERMGYPSGLTEKKWEKTLDEMIWAFETKMKGVTFKDYKRQQKGFELFGKYFGDLWD